MKKQNQWTQGKVQFVFPKLDANLRKSGCSFHMATFDEDVGAEVFALCRDEPSYAKAISQISPLTLIAHSGLNRTPFGVVGSIVWQVAAGSSAEVFFEQYLNPHQIGTLKLVSAAGNQTHFKLVVIDSVTSEITTLIDFDNNFGFDELASAMVLAIGHEPEPDFAAATDYMMANYNVTELLLSGLTL